VFLETISCGFIWVFNKRLWIYLFGDVNPIGWLFMNQMKSKSKKGVVKERIYNKNWTTIYLK
jgi:hypothetical protein